MGPVTDATTPNHSLPSGMFWSQATGKIYSYLAGYGTVVEIDPSVLALTRTVVFYSRAAESYRISFSRYHPR